MKVCTKCGSDEIYFDAWADVNDPAHVVTFDMVWCMFCDQETIPVLKEVYDGQSSSE